MREQLEKLLEQAYVPYSNFPVAAILETKDNNFIPGVNVENGSFGATICAERNAINRAVTEGYKKGDFKNVHLMAKVEDIVPCFLCRQVMSEFFTGAENLYVYNNNDIQVYSLNELMPHPFVLEDPHA